MEFPGELTRRVLLGGTAVLAAGALVSEAAAAPRGEIQAVSGGLANLAPGRGPDGRVWFNATFSFAYASLDGELAVPAGFGLRAEVRWAAGASPKQINEAIAAATRAAVVDDATRRGGVALEADHITVTVLGSA